MKPRFIVFLISLVMAISTVRAQNKPLINHIAVYVADLKMSTHFYSDIVGLEIIPEPFHDGKHTWMSIGDNAALHLIEGAKAVTSHAKDSHLCFSVSSVENFIKQLEKSSIAYENWAGESNTVTLRPDGIKQIYFKDPDGYWIEVNNDRE